MTPKTPLSTLAPSRRWQTNFLGILPAVHNHARICFRRLPPDAHGEAIAATVARAFVDYGDLVRRCKLAHAYPSTLAEYAVRRVRGGRNVGAPQNTRDLFNRDPHRRHVRSLTPPDSDNGTWRELVLEDRRTTPADTAAFNIDFESWLAQWSRRHRHIIATLAAGHRNREVAVRFKISRGRISQLRRAYQRSWERFQGLERAA